MNSPATRPYRLGIDVGSNSLGWFMVWLNERDEPVELGRGGARIYPDGRDPKSKESNAADRRVARSMRRHRDRYLKRRGNLMAQLIKHGLMPAEEKARKALEGLDPYLLRAKALDEALPPYHIGRALFHLNQRRGFLSNRKTEKGDKESGAIKLATGNLQKLMQESGARTLGEFLHRRHEVREPVRTRNRSAGTKAEYDFYPARQMLLDEFDAIWASQAPHHPDMTEEARAAIRHVIFHQRPLKQPPVGKCSLDPAKDKDDAEGFRCSWAHPLAQRFRIWQEVRNLAIVETGQRPRPLEPEEGNKVALALFQNPKFSFDKIRSLLKPPEAKFNLESAKRDYLMGDETAAALSAKKYFGKKWRSIQFDRQIEIVKKLEDEADEVTLISWLVENAGLDTETADRVASAFLPDGHCRLGLRAIKNIIPYMESGKNYPDAAKAAGYDHAPLPTGELSETDRLPYYGAWLQDEVLGSGDERDKNDKRWGRFPNPTVHIGLGQLRRVVNALIKEYGPPTEIALEMTRAFKLSPKKLAELEKELADNQSKNEKRADELRKLGVQVNGYNLLKLRLWEEQNPYDPLDRRCPYTGEVISIQRLFSDEVDIDHLIPFSDSWDDSVWNKVISMRYANRAKGKALPYEAFGTSPVIDGRKYDWADISLRAALLPNNKRWRFNPDAREHFALSGGFQARQLNETGWLARVALHYLSAMTNPYKIHVLPGKLTEMIRRKWGLNELLNDHNYNNNGKNRKDHRHHPVDALVAALTDRKLLHRMASAYDDERQKIEIPLPWPTLRDDLAKKLATMVVSHKPDHGLQAKLHDDTAYGLMKELDPEGEGNLVYRKGFRDLNENEISRIRDRRLRDLVSDHVKAEKDAGKDLKSALLSFAERKDIPGLPGPIRHVRLTKPIKPEYLVPIRDKEGSVYKVYSAGENAFVDILSSEGKWIARATTVFQANNRTSDPDTGVQAGEHVMRVFKGDMLRIDHDGRSKIVKIVRLSPSNNVLYLVEHYEAGIFQARHDDPDDPFRWIFANFDKLREWNAERVRVDELGRVWRVKTAP